MTDQPCRFCDIAAGELDAHVVHQTDETVTFLDRRPVFPGHALVVPRRHVVTLPELPGELLAPLFGAAQAAAGAMVDALGAHGSFVALNNTVSQSVAHLHVHVVPRRFKDGLRGFFWPRHPYGSDEEMAEVAGRLRASLASGPASGSSSR